MIGLHRQQKMPTTTRMELAPLLLNDRQLHTNNSNDDDDNTNVVAVPNQHDYNTITNPRTTFVVDNDQQIENEDETIALYLQQEQNPHLQQQPSKTIENRIVKQHSLDTIRFIVKYTSVCVVIFALMNVFVTYISQHDKNNNSAILRLSQSNMLFQYQQSNNNNFLNNNNKINIHESTRVHPRRKRRFRDEYFTDDRQPTNDEGGGGGGLLRIAFMGNSILYYNDSPRLVQQMIMSSGIAVEQDSCLRGGSTLTSLWYQGNGVFRKFKTLPALLALPLRPPSNDDEPTYFIPHNDYYDVGASNPTELLLKYDKKQSMALDEDLAIDDDDDDNDNGWDFLVLNDYTQGPARYKTRMKSIRTIKNRIAPLLMESSNDGIKSRTIPIILQTHAYRKEGIKGTSDLGSFESFTDKLSNGVKEYATAFNEVLGGGSHNNIARIAPGGEAFRYVYQTNPVLFHKLYSWDNIHPSPYGTYLNACVIYSTIFPGNPPPLYNSNWWDASRYFMPPPSRFMNTVDDDFNFLKSKTKTGHVRSQFHVQFPTESEAMELRRVACIVCGIHESEC